MRARKVDANQSDIVSTFRALGCSVEPRLARIGEGVPDLLVGKSGWCVPVEVKDGSQPPSRRKLTPDEEAWRKAWAGPYAIVETSEQAYQLVAEMERRCVNP